MTIEKMLSTLALVSLVASLSDDELHKKVFESLSKREFAVSSVLKGWQGLDSVPSVILIHLSHKHVIKKEYVALGGIQKRTLSTVYQRVWKEYEKACQEDGLPFTPCIVGLTTCLKKRSLRLSKTTTA